jgi:sugar phosphate isomerase/epimerase
MRHDVVYALGKTGAARSFDGMLPTIAKNAQRVADEAAKRGITTCTENHGYISQDSDRVERLFNAVNRDNFGILVDIGNFVCVDEDNVRAVSRLAPYAVHVHAKDFFIQDFGTCPEGWGTTRGRRYFCGCVLGEGVVPVRQCIDIVRAAGYNGYFSLEYEGKIDCIEGIKRGYAFLRSIDG